MKTVLITGGAGFIGRNLVKALSGKYEIKVFDLFPYENQKEVKELGATEVIVGDIRDIDVVDKAVQGCDQVVHLAADTEVVKSVEEPTYNFEANVNGTFNLLNSAVKNNIEKFVFASSNAVLGEQEPPAHEDMAPKPMSPYGASKLAGEAYCSAFYGSYGLKTVSLRFSNVYGKYSEYKPSVVTIFMKNVMEGKKVTVYGDGKQTRDYIYAEDICRAIELSLEKSVGGEAFQIGTGAENSILDLIEKIKAITGKDMEIDFQPARKGEILRNFSKVDKAKELLGFEAEYDLNKGLDETYSWFK